MTPNMLSPLGPRKALPPKDELFKSLRIFEDRIRIPETAVLYDLLKKPKAAPRRRIQVVIQRHPIGHWVPSARVTRHLKRQGSSNSQRGRELSSPVHAPL